MASTTHHELEQQVRAVEAAYLSNDADRILSLFTDDARMLMPDVDGSGDALRQFIQDVCSRIDTLQFELRTHERWVHGTIAYEMGAFSERFRSDGQALHIAGNQFLRWELGTDGTWRINRYVIGFGSPEAST